jgi:hypothetical protein
MMKVKQVEITKMLGVTLATEEEMLDLVLKLAEVKYLCQVVLREFPQLSFTFKPLKHRVGSLLKMLDMDLEKGQINYINKAYLHLLNSEIDDDMKFTNLALDLLRNKPWGLEAA